MARRRTAYIYSDVLSGHQLRQGHPMQPIRLKYAYELLSEYGAFEEDKTLLVEPRQALEAELLSFHTPDYVNAVKGLSDGAFSGSPARFNFSDQGDNPVYRGMYEAAIWSTGASLRGVELLLSEAATVAFNTSGGLHHAGSGYASGFCIFDDPVIAINRLLAKDLKVAYIDIDAHHGDGVQTAFYDTDQVLTISIHESGQFLFPGSGFADELGTGTGRGYSFNIPLFPYTGDDTYMWALEQIVPVVVKRFNPDVLVTQLGIDTYRTDPLTHLVLTTVGYTRAVRLLADLGYPWLALGGGGYDLMAVARCWTLAYGVMASSDWPNDIPNSFAERYGVTCLRDTEQAPAIELEYRNQAAAFAEETVATLYRDALPLLGVRPG